MEQACVIIPIYKTTLSLNEEKALIQGLDTFKKHPLIVIAPEGLTICQKLKDYKCIRFNKNYFKGINGYNRLMLSSFFYEQFSNYEYMLIYQLDAWVFKDELDYWCKKEYDYIGAPWAYKNEFGKIELRTGNGGFSLRKVSSHKNIFQKWKIIDSRKGIINDFWNQGKLAFIMKMHTWIPRVAGIKNNSKYFIKHFEENEDYFWALYAPQIDSNFKVAPPKEAMKFGFELEPRYLYNLNQKKLPFGCHAWEKHEPNFWKNHIK